MKYKHLLFVEEGSVDTEKIKKDLEESFVYVIAYRMGGTPPEVVTLTQAEERDIQAIGFEMENEDDSEDFE